MKIDPVLEKILSIDLLPQHREQIIGSSMQNILLAGFPLWHEFRHF